MRHSLSSSFGVTKALRDEARHSTVALGSENLHVSIFGKSWDVTNTHAHMRCMGFLISFTVDKLHYVTVTIFFWQYFD